MDARFQVRNREKGSLIIVSLLLILINAELDVSPMRRDMPSNPNPNYFQFINWQETGGL